jgi:carboxymethylenebutenolidase
MVMLTRPEGPLPEDFHLSRRGLAGMFFAGYAAAAFSAEAEPIHTDETGLVTETVMLPAPDRPLPGYLARPAAAGRHPAVLVVSEIFGVHEYIRDVCRRLAKLGYVAVAPAFFIRVGDPAPLTMEQMPEIRRIVGAASDQQVMGDVAATLKFLKAQRYVDASRLAVTGFCWGGRIVWLACERFPEFKAGAAWYGQLGPTPGAKPAPDRLWPIELAPHLSAPVLGLYAGKDPFSAGIPAMKAALAAAGKTSDEFIVYPDAQHGFHADYRSSYNEADAKDGWTRMLAHFAKNGVAPRKS